MRPSESAHAMPTDEVVRYADLIVLAIPMHSLRELRRELFAGKIPVDAMNYWEEIDGRDEQFESVGPGTSALVQDCCNIAAQLLHGY
jgi:8-hydroxy-5-deazaflavin:NADPH oxidoreductase